MPKNRNTHCSFNQTASDAVSKRRVSVIIIFFNESRFIAEAVESVRAQDFNEWELILVDDGSTDESSAIAQYYAQLDRYRIRYITHPGRTNRGMSASRNLGLTHSIGEFVAFLDADDVWLPGKLAEQVAILDSRAETDLLYGRTLIWNSWLTNSEASNFFYDLGVVPDRLYQPPYLFEILLENKAQTPTVCNAIFRRSLLGKIGGFENSFRGMFEDQVFFAKALLNAPVYVDSRVWARYRQHDKSSSASSDAHGDTLLARLRFLKWLKRYVRAMDDINPIIRAAVHREHSRCRIAVIKSVLSSSKSVVKRVIGPASAT